jgi:hypothetical protein
MELDPPLVGLGVAGGGVACLSLESPLPLVRRADGVGVGVGCGRVVEPCTFGA